MEQNKNFSIPMAIIIAGAIIAVGIVIGGAVGGSNSSSVAGDSNAIKNTGDNNVAKVSPKVDNIKPITSEDHILGDINADIKIVEFSDLECPFCKRFHSTMQKIMSEYGENGKVAWVYRHFPLDSLHSKARKEAEASECANELGGNDAFWKYVNRIFEITPSNNGLDPSKLYNVANYIGLDSKKFKQCLDNGKYAQKVNDDVNDAIASGGRGTPYSVVITKSGKKFTIDGAQPYSYVKGMIESILSGN